MGEERALSSTDKRQITRLSSCHLRNRKKPFRVSLDSGRRTPDVLWISFFLSQKSRKLGRVKSSFHGPRGHTEGEERMNTPFQASKIRSARLWFDSVLHTWSYYLFPEKSAFPPSVSFLRLSLRLSATFRTIVNFRRFFLNKKRWKQETSDPRSTDVIWWNLVDYIGYVRSENRISCGSSTWFDLDKWGNLSSSFIALTIYTYTLRLESVTEGRKGKKRVEIENLISPDIFIQTDARFEDWIANRLT